jgi:hypothetical protein
LDGVRYFLVEGCMCRLQRRGFECKWVAVRVGAIKSFYVNGSTERSRFLTGDAVDRPVYCLVVRLL